MKNPVKFLLLLFCLTVLFSCHRNRKVNTSFYYWKTVYQNNKTEQGYLLHFKVKKIYIRITDVAFDTAKDAPEPVSPIIFKDKLPESVAVVPVVFIENRMMRRLSGVALKKLSENIVRFVDNKVKQAGKTSFYELQIDCDWTRSTRKNYFDLLRLLKSNRLLKGRILSVTLRLHQLKNQLASGIPPADRVMLMCYNMGNLRKYGHQNSILDLGELKKYVNGNISRYPIPVNIALPLFRWGVVFRRENYIGISKRITATNLRDENQFIFTGNEIYRAVTDLPAYGLLKGDQIRWEAVSASDLEEAATYLSSLLKTDTVTVNYFHLDENTLSAFSYTALEKINQIFR